MLKRENFTFCPLTLVTVKQCDESRPRITDDQGDKAASDGRDILSTTLLDTLPPLRPPGSFLLLSTPFRGRPSRIILTFTKVKNGAIRFVPESFSMNGKMLKQIILKNGTFNTLFNSTV